MTRAYVRPVTRKQARSYDRVIPNGIGVTTLAAVNGRGAAARARARAHALRDVGYDRRYSDTRRVLRGYSANRASGAPVYGANKTSSVSAAKAAKAAEKAARAAQRAAEAAEAAAVKANKRVARATGGKKSMAAKKKTAAKSKKRRTPAQKAATKRMQAGAARARRAKATKRPAKRKTAKRAAPRKTAKRRSAKRPDAWRTISVASVGKKGKNGKKRKVPLLRAHIGRKTYKTYMTPGKRGSVKHVPLYILQGFGSERERVKFMQLSGADQSPAVGRRQRKTGKIAERVSRTRQARARYILANGDAFTPNAVSYEEWSESMTPNKKKAAKKSKPAKRAKKGTHASRVAAAKKGARTRKRNAKKGIRKTTRKPAARKTAKKGARTRKAGGHKAPAKRKTTRKSAKRRVFLIPAGAKHVKFTKNRRHRSYRRNGAELKAVLMTGVKIGLGFIAHRAISHLIDTNVSAKVDALNTAGYLPYRGLLSGAITALLGVGALEMAKKSYGAEGKQTVTEIQGGFVASLLHQGIVAVLTAQSPKMVPYMGMGEYMPVRGFGSYYQTAGLGAYQQAAAGLGAYQQAAAGLGAYQQAAAGMGEFFLPGATGVGEYIEGAPRRLGIGTLDDGIMPTMNSAERALSIAEAAAGLGDDYIQPQSDIDYENTEIATSWTTDPSQAALDVRQPDSALVGGGGSLTPYVDANLVNDVDPNDEAFGLRTGVLAGGF